MHWILIWYLTNNSGVATRSQEFDTQAACQTAATAINKWGEDENHWWRVQTQAFCVPQGPSK